MKKLAAIIAMTLAVGASSYAGAIETIRFPDFEWYCNVSTVADNLNKTSDILSFYENETLGGHELKEGDRYPSFYVDEAGLKIVFSHVNVAGYSAICKIESMYAIKDGKAYKEYTQGSRFFRAEYVISPQQSEKELEVLKKKLESKYGNSKELGFKKSKKTNGYEWIADDGSSLIILGYDLGGDTISIIYSAPDIDKNLLELQDVLVDEKISNDSMEGL